MTALPRVITERVCRTCDGPFRHSSQLTCNGCRTQDRVCECGTAFRGYLSRCLGCRRESRHGLDDGELREMFDHQGGRCAGCLDDLDIEDLFIDHDHACCPGRWSCGTCVRGLLCKGCNSALGWVRDSPTTLRRLADYLTAGFSST